MFGVLHGGIDQSLAQGRGSLGGNTFDGVKS